ncbi:MAG TPA: response regulator transcription factor [Actinomycetota bacterium]|nr:response regulator transcription factor [Actinomycetota bacterium]
MFIKAGHRKVLIVDDDPGIRQILRLILEVEDFDVVGEAVDGIEAVPQAVASQPDFIVLDEQMPRRGGEETAAMIRNMVPEAQIIAFSAILDAKPAWADAFLRKQNINDVAPLVEGLIDLRD